MTLNTLEAAVATLSFLGPGALFYFTVSMFFPQQLEWAEWRPGVVVGIRWVS